MSFNQKFEPEDGRVIHGAGQSYNTFKRYWDAVEKYKPKIYMAYMKINTISEKVLKLKKELKEFPNLIPQIGLYLGVKNEGEKTEEIMEGDYDEQLNDLIKFAKNFKNPIFMRVGYEFNEPGKYKPDKFVKVWKYIVDLFRKKGVSNVAFVWCCCTAFSREIQKVMEFYPGDNYVDWFGDDLFGVRHFTDIENPKIITKAFVEKSIEHKKPLMIGESSPAETGVDKGIISWNEWFKPYFNWIESNPNIKAFCYINWDWEKDWIQPEWLNGRIEENEEVRIRYVVELSKNKYIHLKK